MRPTPNELIAGIRQLLKDRVGSSLTSPDAIATLRRVMAVLRDVDWNEAGFALEAENRRFLDLLGEIGEWIGGHRLKRLAFDPVADKIRVCEEKSGKINTFHTALDLNYSCRRLLREFVDILADETSDLPTSEKREWRSRLVGVLAEITAEGAGGMRHKKI